MADNTGDEPQKPAQRDISKEDLAKLPLISWNGAVEVLETAQEMHAAVRRILKQKDSNSKTILGFDTETRPNFRKGGWNPTALVQVATHDTVYLFRICKLWRHTFTPLIPLLEHSDFLKCGVGISQDVTELQKVESFTPRGFMEIVDFTRWQLNIKPGGLRSLVGFLLHGRLSKAAQMSNWAKDKLEPKEIQYAATDAWVGRELYVKATQEQAELGLPPVPDIDFKEVARRKAERAKKKAEEAKEAEKNRNIASMKVANKNVTTVGTENRPERPAQRDLSNIHGLPSISRAKRKAEDANEAKNNRRIASPNIASKNATTKSGTERPSQRNVSKKAIRHLPSIPRENFASKDATAMSGPERPSQRNVSKKDIRGVRSISRYKNKAENAKDAK